MVAVVEEVEAVVSRSDPPILSPSGFIQVSQAVCGTQKHHRKIRKIRLAIVKHLKANGGMFRSEYSSMEEYLTVSKMAYVGSWATEVEIQAAADFFGVSIFTYCDGCWLEYSCKDRPLSYQGIYLENCNFLNIVQIKYRTNMSHRNTLKAMSKTEYHKNKCHRDTVKERSKAKYRKNKSHRVRVKEMSIMKYRTNKSHRVRVKEISIIKYRTNKSHRVRVKEISRIKYRTNKSHRVRVKEISRIKYRTNKSHRVRVKEMSKIKYRTNKSHRVRVQEMSKIKYRTNKSHRLNVKSMSRKKYHGNRHHRQRVIAHIKLKRQHIKATLTEFDVVMQQFLAKVNDGPDFVCCVFQKAV
ncbi:hypothetical protein N1851_018935 [Merluccius polli]|uniref:Uncharacterized protein n=1 Tax=Merluccius polli TaxID=89951 RepID=A0AA47NZJ2_MERPO|nr:hypothetical protein N1851_018935 [Merluccius polli]